MQTFATPPDPGAAGSLDDLIAQLRLLKTWAGNPSYTAIARQVNSAWQGAGRPAREWTTSKNTVADYFTVGRRRPKDELLLGIVEALNPDAAYLSKWRQALRVLLGEAEAAAFVQAQSLLPGDIVEFTGRKAELRRLLERVPTPGGGATPVSVIEGMAGIGKTQLAVHAAHRLLDRGHFDQVLFVNLRGFHPDPGQPPADATAVLDSFLRLLRVPGHDIPHDLDGRTRLYRERLCASRTLVVLDNAATAAQVQPLLPGSPTCLTLVTSRRALTGLAGAEHVPLGVFTQVEALDYLRRTVGADRVATDQATAADIANAVGHLPLALRLTAARIAAEANAAWTLADHLNRLRTRRHELRLDEDVEGAISLSYDDLAAEHRQLLRMLSLHPGQDLEANAAAALAGTEQPTAQRILDHLLDNHLLRQRIPGRYELHDLIRGYATARTHDEDRSPDQQAALARLTDHYLHTACAAMDLAYPHERHLRPSIAPPPTGTVALPDQAAARDWLTAELANLLAVATHPLEHGRPGSTVHFSRALHRHLLTAGHFFDAVALHQHATTRANELADRGGQAHAQMNLGRVYELIGRYEQAADQHRGALALFSAVGDQHGQGTALTYLALVHERIGQYAEATEHLTKALATFRDLGDRLGQARALGNLSLLDTAAGQFKRAVDHIRQALALFREVGDRAGEATALDHLGSAARRLGRYEQAADQHRQALTIFQDIGDRTGEAYALSNLGFACQWLGQCERAAEQEQQALVMFRKLDNRHGQAYALIRLGDTLSRLGRFEQATVLQLQGLDLCCALGDPAGQAYALNGLGATARMTGDATGALDAHTKANLHATAVGKRREQARAHTGLGHAYHDLGDLTYARENWRQALRIYTELGVPEADEVRAALTALTNNAVPQ